jgi:murein DD-endopeptidase MepM/ murein hydrolase activator NlpD
MVDYYKMKLLKPKGWLSQGFGLNDVDYKLYGYKGHPGVDFVQGFNYPIQACADGLVYKIVNKDCKDLSGQRSVHQLVEDGDIVWELSYLHVLNIYCGVGDFLVAGQTFSTEGNTGACWTVKSGVALPVTAEERILGVGSHLHFSAKPCKRVSKITKNPEDYLYTETGDKYFDGHYYEIIDAGNGLNGNVDPTPYFYTPSVSEWLAIYYKVAKNILKSL